MSDDVQIEFSFKRSQIFVYPYWKATNEDKNYIKEVNYHIRSIPYSPDYRVYDERMIINWNLLYNEAKQRRKQQKFTQKNFALLAGVSTPTIIKFEKGDQNMQIESVLKILFWLGLVDKTDEILEQYWARIKKEE